MDRYLLNGFGGLAIAFIIMRIIIEIAVVVGVIYLIVYLVKSSNKSSSSKNRALEILKERYARGEISEEEFEEKRKKIME